MQDILLCEDKFIKVRLELSTAAPCPYSLKMCLNHCLTDKTQDGKTLLFGIWGNDRDVFFTGRSHY